MGIIIQSRQYKLWTSLSSQAVHCFPFSFKTTQFLVDQLQQQQNIHEMKLCGGGSDISA